MALALTWQVDQILGRERLTITLDDAEQDSRTVRNGPQSVGLNLEQLPADLVSLSGGGSLVQGLSLENGQLNISTTTPAFAFVAQRPADNIIVIDFIADPMGARWQSQGGLAPANPPPAETNPPMTLPEPDFTPEEVPVQPADLPESVSISPLPDTQDPAGQTEPVLAGNPADPLEQTSIASLPDSQANVLTSPPAGPDDFAELANTPEQIPAENQEVGSEVASGQNSVSDPETPVTQAPTANLEQPEQNTPASLPTAEIPVPDFSWPDANEPAAPTASAAPQAPIQTGVAAAPAGQNGLNQDVLTNTLPLSADQESVPTPAQEPPVDATEPVRGIAPINPDDSAQGLSEANNPADAVPDQTHPEIAPTPALPGLSGTAPVEVRLAAPADDPDSSQPIILFQFNPGGPQTWPENQGVNFSPTGVLPQTDISDPVEQPHTDSPQTLPETSQNASLADAQIPSPETAQDDEPVGGIATDPAIQSPEPDAVPDQADPLAETGAETETIPAEQTETQPEEQPVELEPIYMDEQGNVIPPPPDIPALLQEARDLMAQGNYTEAEPKVLFLLDQDLDPADREDMLYFYMDILYEKGKPDFTGSAEDVIQAANAAMNFNQQSPKIPTAYNAMAMVSIAQDNFEETEAYINLLRRLYPFHPDTPSLYLALGQKLLNHTNYADASRALQIIVQEYPDTNAAAEAARLQTYSLYNQGHYDRALTMLDFVERRWPRIYLNDPNFLALAADIRLQQGELAGAVNTFWMLYNLDPNAASAPGTLQQIAALYFQIDDKDAARNVLERIVATYPDSSEAPLALLRIGENQAYTGTLGLDQILNIFEQPNRSLPSLYYSRILNDYPDSPVAVTAQLHTMAWQYWNKEYTTVLPGARSYAIEYQDRPEGGVAEEIMLRSFAMVLNMAISEQNYERAVTLWENYPQLQQYYEPLETEVRLALGRGYMNRGEESKGLEILQPFLEDGGDPLYGFYTYNTFLNSMLNQQDWGGILNLGDTVSGWNLPLDAQLQLDYVMALSAENLGLQGRSINLWQKLAPRDDIPLYQRAYANYFLARDAERRQDLRDSYQYNLDTLGMFLELRDQQSPYQNEERVRESIAALMDVTEISGRYAEALEWANQYAAFVPLDSPDYAGLRLREARLHRKMGDDLRWRSILQSIIDSEPDSVFGQMAAAELRTEDVARDLSRFTQSPFFSIKKTDRILTAILRA